MNLPTKLILSRKVVPEALLSQVHQEGRLIGTQWAVVAPSTWFHLWPANTRNDNFGRMGIDLSNAWKSTSRIIDVAISLLPNAILAAVIFIIFLVLTSAAKSIVRRLTARKEKRQSLGLLLGQLSQVAIVILGFLIALSTIAPSFRASDLIKVLGIGNVAIGFAFQNILQNFLAGILILIHEPFKLGDSISVTGLEGTVDDIATRATIITMSDGHRAVIPNAILFTNPVVVKVFDPTKPPSAEANTPVLAGQAADRH